MRTLFVVNRSASRVRARPMERAIRERFPSAAIAVDATPVALRAACYELATTPGSIAVAVGGDGTVHRLVNAARDLDVRLGIVPLGCANDLARELRVPQAPDEALAVIEDGYSIRIDLVSVNRVLFATCGGAGAAASAAERGSRWMRWRGPVRALRRLGRGVYLASALRELAERRPSTRYRVGHGVGPDGANASRNETVSGEALALLVSNQRRFGGGFQASPRASNRDGAMDFCLVPSPENPIEWARLARAVWTGRLDRARGAVHFKTSDAVVRASAPVRFFGDGEILAEGRAFRLRVLPGAARMIVSRPAPEA